jgi:hypothetical protein
LSWIGFGLGHLIFPKFLGWETALANVPPGGAFGILLSNRSVIYLFNADLLLYGVMLGVMSILFAGSLRKGKRTAAILSVASGIFFLVRGALQSYYFGFSLFDALQWAASLVYAAIYFFPLTSLKDFAEE